ncbi:MAG: serine protease [Pedobacter sp.]|jgi:V8-like Glu-specific endopeptidase|uniref:S1 family peptidase n=1 Tax=Pedobacter sp. TaxID=1411316 RepID=UPI00356A6A26
MISDKFEEQIFFTTTRITIPSETGNGEAIGTGFILNAPLNDPEGRSVTLLISNKHVFVNPLGSIAFNFNHKTKTGNPDFGNIHTFSGKDFSALYTEHPDAGIDLACINASIITQPEHNVFYKNLTHDMLSDFNEDQLMPGLDVWFVGYPENRFDVTNNLPLLRRGYIASYPKVDFNSRKLFVIDAQVFQGSSGSPVFAPIGGHFKLIGIVTETMIKHGQLQAIPTLHANVGVQQILGLGLVIKATALKELIDLAVNKLKASLKIYDEPTNEK